MKTNTAFRVAALPRTLLKFLLCGVAAALCAMPGTANATLGNYPNTTVQLSGNTTVTPDAAPTNTASINVSTSTNFKGRLEGNPGTGVVRVTDAHPAGVYTVTITGFEIGGGTSTATFTLTVTTPLTCNPVTFAPPANFSAGTSPVFVAVGDFNGDGEQDLAVANNGSNNVSILLGDGAGSFGAATNFAVGGEAFAIAVGDFDGDGDQDLAVANRSSTIVSVLLGNGMGGFGPATNFTVGNEPLSLAVGDFDSDGREDLVVGNRFTNFVSVLLNDGMGGFMPAVNFGAGSTPHAVAVGDFDGDGDQDVAAANFGTGTVTVLLGDGMGSFPIVNTFAAGTNPRSVAIGDFNEDGNQDIAIPNSTVDTLSVLLGNGMGGFGSATNFPAGDFPISIVVGDFNGDGKQDLAAANNKANNVSVLLNTTLTGSGTVTFDPRTDFVVGTNPWSLAVGDFNGDGKQDFATPIAGLDDVSVLLRQCPSATLGNYPNTTVPLSGNTTVIPDAAPTNTTGINVSTSTNFKGLLEGNPGTGVVRVTDAHPAGTYMVTVTGFDSGGGTTLKTFTLTVTTPATCNPVSFANATNFAAGTEPRSVAVGDFNGDGKQDLATSIVGNVSVVLGNGTGGFGPATNFGVGNSAESVTVADFNGDGKQDLVTANAGSNSVSVLLGNGAGGFGAASNFGVGFIPRTVAVGDFNSDGRQDLAVANDSSANVSVLLGDGAGSFSVATNFSTGAGPTGLVVGDFNGDGNRDLATANRGGGNDVSLLLGNGAGGFGAATTFAAGTDPLSIAMGNFNADGNQDLVVTNTGSNNVSVLLGDGMGSFGTAANFPAGAFPRSVSVGDFNGDGTQDLSITNRDANNVSVLLGNGAGAFNAALDFAVGSMPIDVVVGDFNSDGKQDIAVANPNSNNVSVLLRQCVATTPTPTASPGPSNDLCFGAIVIPPAGPFPHLTSAVDITNATIFGDPPLPTCQTSVSRSIWYTFTPAVTAPYTISSCQTDAPASTLPDDVITIFTSAGGCAGRVTQLPGAAGCDDDSCTTLASQAIISNTTLNAGTQYFIVVYKSGATAPTIGAASVQLQITQAGGASPTPTPTPTPTPATPTPTPPTPTPTATPTPTPPTPTPTPATPTPTPPTPTPTSTPAIPTPTPTASPTPTPAPTQTPAPPPGNNISTRGRVGTGDNVVIGGFIITGNAPRRTMIRAIGPSLVASGITNVLADPTLELRASNGSLIRANDNWRDSQQAEIEATGIPPRDDLESAIVETLLAGSYTAIIRGTNQGTGVALLEIYDLDQSTNSKVANISTRALVQTGDNVLIGGFMLGGGSGQRVVVRGIGPSLTRAGLSNALADPTLTLHNSNGDIIAANDDWKEPPDNPPAHEIKVRGLAPTEDRESAVIATLAPGPYTTIVAGKNGGIGIGLVEVYNLQ